jgi:uncharacterized protein
LHPLRFGPVGRQLLAMLHPPTHTSVRGHTVLLCNPFGQEAIRCHRLLRVLSERLARAGFHVMRFDYLGTGDSDGDDAQGHLPAWVADVLRANDEAQRWSGNTRCSWFGVRLGATLAALASAQVTLPPELLVLWDPIISGPPYLIELAQAHTAELKALHANPQKRYPIEEANALTQALGFAISPQLLEQLRGLSVDAFKATQAKRIRLITGPAAQDTAALAAYCSAHHMALERQVIDTHIVWASDEAMNTAIVPAEPMQAIVQAFEEVV